jgi:hypothetical protein
MANGIDTAAKPQMTKAAQFFFCKMFEHLN